MRHPPDAGHPGTLVEVFLVLSFAFQVMALREVTHGLRPTRTLVGVATAAVVVALVVPRVFPQLDVLALAHAAVPLVAWRSLRTLATQGAGGAVAAVAITLGALPSWAVLANLGGLTDRGPTTFIILCDLLSLFGASLGLLLWHQGNIQQLLQRLATSDALTDALNRHGFMPQLAAELARAQRRQRPVSVVVCDLDHFKRVNDQHGHPAGDAVLQAFVVRARTVLRSTDILGRLGGEEFAFVLSETQQHEAVQVMERMRALPLAVPGVPEVTFSAGIATATAGGNYDAVQLLQQADRRLYLAKETRDRIVDTDTP